MHLRLQLWDCHMVLQNFSHVLLCMPVAHHRTVIHSARAALIISSAPSLINMAISHENPGKQASMAVFGCLVVFGCL